jgi:hypothetical protein
MVVFWMPEHGFVADDVCADVVSACHPVMMYANE